MASAFTFAKEPFDNVNPALTPRNNPDTYETAIASSVKQEEFSSDEPAKPDRPTPHWPQTVPPDLRRKLENVMGYRQFGPQDLWGESREWLVAHGVEVPRELPKDGVQANSSRSD